jgi:phospholipase/carboxylesterase
MDSESLTLPHLVEYPAPESSAGRERPATILALHGRGSNENDLLGLAPHLPGGLLWISPRAPLLLGPGAYEWYRVREIGRPDPEQVHSAIQTLHKFIEEILETYPIDSQKLFLLGFSQGSLISMCYALTYPARVAGVIGHSGYLPGNVELEVDQGGIHGKPFLLIHGQQDTLIPVEWGRTSRDRLQAWDVQVEYHEFPMGHTVSRESLGAISAWLGKYL